MKRLLCILLCILMAVPVLMSSAEQEVIPITTIEWGQEETVASEELTTVLVKSQEELVALQDQFATMGMKNAQVNTYFSARNNSEFFDQHILLVQYEQDYHGDYQRIHYVTHYTLEEDTATLYYIKSVSSDVMSPEVYYSVRVRFIDLPREPFVNCTEFVFRYDDAFWNTVTPTVTPTVTGSDIPTVTTSCFCEEHLNATALLIPGDIDKDGAFTASDALLVLQCATSPKAVYNRYKRMGACISSYVADVNADGNINAGDALDILKMAVGKLDRFAVPVAIPDATLYQQPSF